MTPTPSPTFTIHIPPTRPSITQPSIILFGTMDYNPSTNWRTTLSNSLSDLPITVLDPTRSDWDSSWIESPSFPPFKEQVDWEMDYGQLADIAVFYFAPGSLTPVALLELGMYVSKGKGRVVVCCPEGFYKKGNVDIVCGRWGIEVLGDLEGLERVVRGLLVERVEGA